MKRMPVKTSKTPISILQEFCIKKWHTAPIYILIEDGTNLPTPDKSFVYEVIAFDYKADGRGRNKKNAKHEAAVNLISILGNDEQFRKELGEPEVPRDACPDIDAVSSLMDICVDRDLPIAQFRIQQASGAAHAPKFVVECQVARIVRVGVFSSIKGAKQLAAKRMLDVLQGLEANGHLLKINNRTEELPMKVFKRYFEKKKEEIKVNSGTKLADRYLFFVNLNDETKRRINDILEDENEADQEKVYLMCEALNCKYEVNSVPNHKKRNVHCVEILGEYDLCFASTVPEVYTEILDYVRVGLNFHHRLPITES